MSEEMTVDSLDQIDALLSGEEEPTDSVESTETDTPVDGVSEEIEANTEAENASDEAEDDVSDDQETDAEDEEVIDYDMQIPLGDGRDAVSLSVMKDAYQNLERSKDDVDKQRMKLIASEQELNQFMQQTGVEIPQQFREHMQNQQNQYLQSQHQLMMQMMPELQDKGTFDSMRDDIVKVAAGSNFTAEEIGQVADARIVHLLSRLAKLEAREAKAQETVKQIKEKKPLKAVKPRQKTKTSNIDKQINAALESGNQAQKDAAIDAMLTG